MSPSLRSHHWHFDGGASRLRREHRLSARHNAANLNSAKWRCKPTSDPLAGRPVHSKNGRVHIAEVVDRDELTAFLNEYGYPDLLGECLPVMATT